MDTDTAPPPIERLHFNDLLPRFVEARPGDPDYAPAVIKSAGELEPLRKILNDYHQVEQRAREIRHKLTTGQAIAADDPFPGVVRFAREHVQRHLDALNAAAAAAEELVTKNDLQFRRLAEAARPTPGSPRPPEPPAIQPARQKRPGPPIR